MSKLALTPRLIARAAALLAWLFVRCSAGIVTLTTGLVLLKGVRDSDADSAAQWALPVAASLVLAGLYSLVGSPRPRPLDAPRKQPTTTLQQQEPDRG